MDDFLALGEFIDGFIDNERPERVLEVSACASEYGHLISALLFRRNLAQGGIDRVALAETPANSLSGAYANVIEEHNFDKPGVIGKYDFVLFLNLTGQIEPDRAIAMIKKLQYNITKQILFLTPVDSAGGYRKYHPLVFLGMDICYYLPPGVSTKLQAYSIFSKIRYEPLAIDYIPSRESIERLKIAFALPYHGLTGGMKALVQQLRQLHKKGHTVNVYFRSDHAKHALPPWSGLTQADYSSQTVIPASAQFKDYIKHEDVTIFGGIHQAPELLGLAMPVVLWEQGAEAVFGDYSKVLYSASDVRLREHIFYRLPFHLLAVSDVIAASLQGVYNRKAYVYHNGIDTEFYHPCEKHNDEPVILLCGHPSLSFKGFHFAFNSLKRAYAEGLSFKVRWAAQVNVLHGAINFPLEVIRNPPQHELAQIYRNADILLSSSLYESYSLPPLEAMASGVAVVATDCGGIHAYARHGENCILLRQGDISAAVNALRLLIENPQERLRLSSAGRQTAIDHSAQNVVGKLEARLCDIVRHKRMSKE